MGTWVFFSTVWLGIIYESDTVVAEAYLGRKVSEAVITVPGEHHEIDTNQLHSAHEGNDVNSGSCCCAFDVKTQSIKAVEVPTLALCGEWTLWMTTPTSARKMAHSTLS